MRQFNYQILFMMTVSLLMMSTFGCTSSEHNSAPQEVLEDNRIDSLHQVIYSLETQVDALQTEIMDISVDLENPSISVTDDNWFSKQLLEKAPMAQIAYQFYTQTIRTRCMAPMFGGSYDWEEPPVVNSGTLRFVYGCINDQFTIKQIGEFYGMPVFRKLNQEDDGDELSFWSESSFSYYNPQFVKLMNQQVLAIQKNPIGRAIMREVYNSYFKDYLRKFWLAKEWLYKNPSEMDQLRSQYNQIMQDDTRYLYNGLFDNGNWPMQQHFSDQREVSYALAFWMRRQTGGTDDEFQELFRNVLNTVDERFSER